MMNPKQRVIFAWNDAAVKIKLWVALSAILFLLLSVSTTTAHGYIVRAIPEDRAVLERAPVRVQYWFSEALEREFSAITVRNTNGEVIAEGGVDENDLTLLAVRLPTNLPDGTYLSELKIAFSSDGHLIYETRAFFVGVAASDVGSGSSDLPVPLEVVWRAILLSSSTLLLGVFVLYSLTLVPAWGNPQYAAGLLPPRVMDRLNKIVIVGLIGAFIGNILALLQQSMVFFNTDIGRVLGDGLWNIVRIGTRFGDMWNARMAFLVLVALMFAASLYYRKEQPSFVRAFWTANIWVMALVFGTFSASSHAAGSLTVAWLAVISDWLHGLASGFWAGGVAALALVLPVALQPLSGETQRRAMLTVLNRFTLLATGGVIIVIGTGIYNALNWVTEPAHLTTTYSAALILKSILVVLLVGVGALHHIALRPQQYARFSGLINRAQAYLPTLKLEAVLVFAVLIAVGGLASTPVPTPDLAGQTAPPPSETQVIGDYTVTTSITPGGPGVNTYDVVIVDANDQPVDNANLILRMNDPALDWRGSWHIMEPIGDGLYASAGDEISTTGNWWTMLQINGEQLPFAWNISQDAAVLQSRPPSLWNWLALVGVILAITIALLPLIRRFIKWLDWTPVVVTVAVLSTAITVVLFGLTIYWVTESNTQYYQAVIPPPQIINDVLPTQDSLETGETLAAACGWLDTSDLETLITRLSRTRDEELFAYTVDGWRSLAPCGAQLSDTQRWHIVNYLRALEPISAPSA